MERDLLKMYAIHREELIKQSKSELMKYFFQLENRSREELLDLSRSTLATYLKMDGLSKDELLERLNRYTAVLSEKEVEVEAKEEDMKNNIKVNILYPIIVAIVVGAIMLFGNGFLDNQKATSQFTQYQVDLENRLSGIEGRLETLELGQSAIQRSLGRIEGALGINVED